MKINAEEGKSGNKKKKNKIKKIKKCHRKKKRDCSIGNGAFGVLVLVYCTVELSFGVERNQSEYTTGARYSNTGPTTAKGM